MPRCRHRRPVRSAVGLGHDHETHRGKAIACWVRTAISGPHHASCTGPASPFHHHSGVLFFSSEKNNSQVLCGVLFLKKKEQHSGVEEQERSSKQEMHSDCDFDLSENGERSKFRQGEHLPRYRGGVDFRIDSAPTNRDGDAREDHPSCPLPTHTTHLIIAAGSGPSITSRSRMVIPHQQYMVEKLHQR